MRNACGLWVAFTCVACLLLPAGAQATASVVIAAGESCALPGDANGSGTIEIDDVTSAFGFYLGLSPAPFDESCADLCTNQTSPGITPADAQEILLGGAETPESECADGGAASVSFGEQLFSGASFEVPLVAESSVEISSMGIDIVYDPLALTFTGATMGAAFTGWQLATALQIAPGRVRVGAMHGVAAKVPAGTFQIATLEFEVFGGTCVSETAISLANPVDALFGATLSGGVLLCGEGGEGDPIDEMPWSDTLLDESVSALVDHQTVVFNGAMWRIAGSETREVWRSADGTTWEEQPAAEWIARTGHTCVVFDDKIWVLGGYRATSNPTRRNDVWQSDDGINWTSMPAADWSGRNAHAAVVFDGKMWVIGGQTASGVVDDVWYSMDGETWVLATDTPGWSPRRGHQVLAFNDALWLLGGQDTQQGFADVWRSSNGETWTHETSPPWPGRFGHAATVHDGRMWVAGGSTPPVLNDAWYSSDGDAWTQANAAALWPGQLHLSLTSFRNKLWMFGTKESSVPGAWFAHGYAKHSADTDANEIVSLSELLRVLQFFNTGGIRCADEAGLTEDDFTPFSEEGATSCPPHDADYATQDWSLDLPEALRVIQLFNAGGYERCAAGEDGFCTRAPAAD